MGQKFVQEKKRQNIYEWCCENKANKKKTATNAFEIGNETKPKTI